MRLGTNTHRQKGTILVHAAMGLYIVSLALPAITIAATQTLGWRAVCLSFEGACMIFGSQLERGQAPACLIGALANLLFVSTYFALLVRRYLPVTWPTYEASAFMARLAAAGTLGVLIPLAFGSEEFSVSIGYFLWVGAATLLTFAARHLRIAEVAEPATNQPLSMPFMEQIRRRLPQIVVALVLLGVVVVFLGGKVVFILQFGHLPHEQRIAVAELQELNGRVILGKNGEVHQVLMIAGKFGIFSQRSSPSQKVTDTSLDYLQRFPELEYVVLGGCRQITDAGLEHLKDLASLRRLDLSHTRITDAGLAHLRGLTNLQNLRLANTEISDAGLMCVKELTSLKMLDLYDTSVTDTGLEYLTGLTKLERLDLGRTQISDAGLEHLHELTNLKFVNLNARKPLNRTMTIDGVNMTTDVENRLRQALPDCEFRW